MLFFCVNVRADSSCSVVYIAYQAEQQVVQLAAALSVVLSTNLPAVHV